VPERGNHQRVVGVELFPHRIGHGPGTVVCLYRIGGNDCPAGDFLGGIIKAAVDSDISAFFHTIRLFGGNLGAVFMGHFIAQREKLHSNLLGVHVQSGNWISDSSIRQVTAGLFSKSFGVAAATGRAVGVISGRLRLQAYTLSFIDGFYLVAWACFVALLLVAMLRKSR
jgi:hypothetical protein